jgi:hypothetical protein
MGKKLIGALKIDAVMPATALNNTNGTSEYVDLRGYGKILASVSGAALAATKTTTAKLVQANTAAGGGSKDLTVSATKTLTANTNVNIATFDLTSVANTDTVTVNGITFTKAAANSASLRTFADGAGLVTLLNSDKDTANDVLASGTTTVTVKSRGLNKSVTASSANVAGTIVTATTHHQIQVEADGYDLDLANGFYWVAVNVATTGNSTFSAHMIRSDRALTPVTQVGEQFAG